MACANNGRLASSDLVRIYDPHLKLYLAKDNGAAAGWNTMRMWSLHHFGVDIYTEGPNGAYRTYDAQVLMKELYGANAATPGYSNHGCGDADDLANPTTMAPIVINHGAPFGWGKTDAMWENWHVNRTGTFSRPNPGINSKYPILRQGSGGHGQAFMVVRLQKWLRRRGVKVDGHYVKIDGDFGKTTKQAVKAYQRDRHLKDDGVVGRKTWRRLVRP